MAMKILPLMCARIWKYAGQDIGVRVTPQVLCEWFCDEMGRLGMPDRYVNDFCGRIPSSVLSKNYTNYSPEKMKVVYVGAGLEVLR